MANNKLTINDLPNEVTSAAAADLLPIWDDANATTAKISITNVIASVVDPAVAVEATNRINADDNLQDQIDLKAPLASPALTGSPTTPTAAPGTNTTAVASTAFVTAAVNAASGAVVSVNGETGAVTIDATDVGLGGFTGLTPATLPLSTATTGALAANVAATTAALNLKANIASPTFTGTPAAPTAAGDNSTTQLATTAFVQNVTGHLTERTLTSFDPVDLNNAMQLASAWVRAGTYSIGGSQIPQNNRRIQARGLGLITLSQSVNLQGIAAQGGWGIDATGSTFLLTMTGKTGFDLLGSRWGYFVGMNLVGDRTNKPAIGIQVGRLYGAGVSADGHVWERLTTSGNFTREAFYNLASETGGYHDCAIYNQQDDGSTGRAMTFDGYNLYGAITDFTLPAIAPNTYMSCIQHCFTNLDARNFVRGHPIEIVNTDQFEMYTSYAVGWDAGIKIIGSGQGHVLNLHCEPSGDVDCAILFQSIGGGIQEMRNFFYRDHQVQTINAPLQKTAGTASVRLINADIGITKGGSSTATTVFGTGFTVSGHVFAGNLSLDNMTNFVGTYDVTDTASGTTRPAGSYAMRNALTTDILHKGQQTFAGDLGTITGTALAAGANVSFRNAVAYLRSPSAVAQALIAGVSSATSYTATGGSYLDFASGSWLNTIGVHFDALNSDGSRSLSALSADPASPIEGSEWVNGTTNLIKTRQGAVTRAINTTP